MKKAILLLTTVLSVAACGPSTILLVHPESRERVACSSPIDKPTGIPTLAMRASDVESCAKQYEGLGFVRAENLAPAEREIQSKPTPIVIDHSVTVKEGK